MDAKSAEFLNATARLARACGRAIMSTVREDTILFPCGEDVRDVRDALAEAEKLDVRPPEPANCATLPKGVVIEGVDPPLSIDEVRRIRADAADGAARGSKLFVVSPDTAVRLCDAIERGYTVVDPDSPKAREERAKLEAAQREYALRHGRCACSTTPTFADVDARHDQELSELARSGGPNQQTLGGLFGLCPAVARRRDYWKQAARKWEKAWVSASREINRLNVAAQDKDAEIRRLDKALANATDEIMRGDAGTIRRLQATVGDLTNGLAIANRELDAERKRIAWLNGEREGSRVVAAVERQRSGELIAGLERELRISRGEARSARDEVRQLACALAGVLDDASSEVLAGGSTAAVARSYVEDITLNCRKATLFLGGVALDVPSHPAFVTFWREDPRKAAPK